MRLSNYPPQPALAQGPAGPPPGSAATRLGTNAESFTPPLGMPSERAEARAERFELQAVARDLLRRRGAALGHAFPANYHKTAKCLYTPFDKQVHVYRSQQHGNAFYGGLVVCAKPGCPVCAAKVSERRRVEIAHAFDWAYNNGKKVIMLTFTHPHRAWDPLADQLKRQSQAFAKLRAGNPWKRILPDGYEGLIRSLEVTYGRNGWHPHLHEAWIVDKDADVSELRRKVLKRWFRVLCRVGMVTLPPSGNGKRFAALRAFWKRSVDVMDNASTSDYLAKHDEASKGAWGVDREIAKASSKKGRRAGRTPFQLLAACRDGDEKAGRLYVDYVEAIKGKPPVFWSQGLKALVGVDELNDQQIAERHDDKADVLGLLDMDDWRMVRRAGYRAHLLQAAEEAGWPGVQSLLAFLRHRVPPEPAEPTPEERTEAALAAVTAQAESVHEAALAEASANVERWNRNRGQREDDLCLQGVLYCTTIDTVQNDTLQYSTGDETWQ